MDASTDVSAVPVATRFKMDSSVIRYELTSSLVTMYQNGEALLFDYNFPNPLYFSRGREAVEFFLKQIPASGLALQEISNPDYQVLAQLLLKHGILVPFGQQKKIESSACNECQISGRPREINCYLLLSQYCNLACVYCFNGDESYARMEKKIMQPETAFRAVDLFLERLAPQGTFNLIFFGGEPLLNWDLARNLLKRYGEREFPEGKTIHFHLTSNLLVFPPGLIEDIQKYHITILCDVDGPPQLHDKLRPRCNGLPSHEMIRKNLELLQKNNIPYNLRATVTRANVHAIPQIVKHHIELGGAVSSLVAVNPVTSDETVLPLSMLPDPKDFAYQLLSVYREKIIPDQKLFPINQMLDTFKIGGTMQFPCGAPQGTTPTVDVNGDIYPCIYFVGISRLKWCSITDDFDLYRSPLLKKLEEETSVENFPTCQTCHWKYFCGGGCPVKRVLIQENPQADEEVRRYCREITCLPSKILFPELIWEYSRQQHKKNKEKESYTPCV